MATIHTSINDDPSDLPHHDAHRFVHQAIERIKNGSSTSLRVRPRRPGPLAPSIHHLLKFCWQQQQDNVPDPLSATGIVKELALIHCDVGGLPRESFSLLCALLASPACTIETLCLAGNRLDDASSRAILQAVCDNTSVTCLDLNSNFLSSVQLGKHLGRLLSTNNKKLERLILSYNRIPITVSTQLSQGLAQCRHLQELDLHGCLLGDEGVAPVVAVLAPLLPQGSAKRWHTATTTATPTPTTTTTTAMTTTTCCYGATPSSEGALPSLTTLRLSVNELRNTTLLVQLIRGNPHLETLDLQFNVDLFREIRPSVTTNQPPHAPFPQYEVSYVDAHQPSRDFGDALRVNTSLKSLRLAQCGLTGPTVAPIFRALETNTCLQFLDIQHNHLEVEEEEGGGRGGMGGLGCRQLGASLPSMQGLQHLRMDEHLIPSPNILQRNTSLIRISPSLSWDKQAQEEMNEFFRRNRLWRKTQQIVQTGYATPLERKRLDLLVISQESQFEVALREESAADTSGASASSSESFDWACHQWCTHIAHEPMILYSLLQSRLPGWVETYQNSGNRCMK